jgi:2-oxoisovalerate dehydrogenase E2 component (dihydrolipoyl transacylase)
MVEVRDFLLPDLGEGLEDAEVVTWRVAEGDAVALNQILIEVNTAKALVEIPAPWAGVVERLHAAEGDVVAVGAPLVSIRTEEPVGAPPPAPDRPAPAEAPPPGPPPAEPPRRTAVLVGYGVEEDEPARSAVVPPPAAPATDAGTEAAARTGPVAATPPVRRLARELGVDLSRVSGTGPEGRVVREDVVRAADDSRAPGGPRAVAPAPQATGARESRTVRVTGTRRLIAAKMARSAREIPQVTTFQTVDCSTLLAFRDRLRTASGERIGPLPIVVAALIRTIDAHPTLNASFDAEADGGPQIVFHGPCHVGVATDTDGGLLVPVVRDTDRLGIGAIGREIARLADAARTGRATPADLTGGTITVSNVGSFGAESGTPIINHPEGAILALGIVEPRALVVDGRVEARPATTLSLTFDHRLMDGAEAGRALRALKDLLEDPFELGSLPR